MTASSLLRPRDGLPTSYVVPARPRSALSATLLVLACASCAGPREASSFHDSRIAANDAAQIRAVLAAQVAAWNRGDLDAFAATYEKSEELVFKGPDELSTGWESMLARYKKGYPDKRAMGTLRFEEISLSALGPTTVSLAGRWFLQRKDGNRTGHFAIVLRKFDDGWKIVMDYSNSESFGNG